MAIFTAIAVVGLADVLLASFGIIAWRAEQTRRRRADRRDGGVGVAGDEGTAVGDERGWFRRWFDGDGDGGGDGGGGGD